MDFSRYIGTTLGGVFRGHEKCTLGHPTSTPSVRTIATITVATTRQHHFNVFNISNPEQYYQSV